ncbi:hypothetical protein LCGC14_2970390, partial [marine sediment metagenome]
GGASGISRGIYVAPTITAAADFRALEVADVGATHFALKTGTGEVSFGDKVSAVPGGNIMTCQLFTIGFADLTDGDGSETEALFTMPPRGKMVGTSVKTSVAFSGGTLSDMDVALGNALSENFYQANFDIFQAVGDTVFKNDAMFIGNTMAQVAITALFTATGDTMANVDAGSVDIDLCWVVLP